MVSTRLMISKSFSSLSILWGLFQVNQLQMASPSPSIVFFSYLARSWYLSLFLLSFNFTLSSNVMVKSTIRQGLFLGWLSLSVVVTFYYYYYYSLIRAFHISVSRWFFTGVWVTASLLKSPGLFLVFWPFSAMVSTRPPTSKSFSPFSNPLITVPILLLLLLLLLLFRSLCFFFTPDLPDDLSLVSEWLRFSSCL